MSLLLLLRPHGTGVTPPVEPEEIEWTRVEAADVLWERVEVNLDDWTVTAPPVLPIEARVLQEGFIAGVLPTDDSISLSLGEITPVAGTVTMVQTVLFIAVNGSPTPEITISGGGIDSWVEQVEWEYSNDGETAIVYVAWAGWDHEPGTGEIFVNFPTADIQFLEMFNWSVVELKHANQTSVLQEEHSDTQDPATMGAFTAETNATLGVSFYFDNVNTTDIQPPAGMTFLTSTYEYMVEEGVQQQLIMKTFFSAEPVTEVSCDYYSPAFDQRFLLNPSSGMELSCHIPTNDDEAIWAEIAHATSSWQRREHNLTSWS